MQIRTLLAGSAMLAVLAGCATGTSPQGQPGAPEQAEQPTVYSGTLPCRSCDGIDLEVQLMGDEGAPADERTFELQAEYQNHPENPPAEEYEGQWEVIDGTAKDPKATVYELTPNGEGQIYYFLKLDANTLELIDPQLRRFENGETLRLQRQQ
ncbi:copper resistance protein NlpE N-terminal domain-containing protein [Chromohalobacter sp. HP20-39]|uniref:copper resistance protein NlpE N-terminal domain-containing protein n=1 Tax=Chromohalobacter sp. HP20-39 TaxID=3079306 RepID=UPI00294AD5FD|nr:copper resistance protein NlpE N-terminal domain-containing protein [Chromohalobacter sp. HP20-39]MDV6320223.1 copper resistance protein NlpE N-terminal domain-containing protein [Chromohalobacter sp. HP20-39]